METPEQEQNQNLRQLGMEYNSGREKLILPEYGRHVQKMVNYVRTIEDKAQRQIFVELIVRLMEQMQGDAKPSKELTNKLWNHVFIVGEYALDVDPPEDVEIVRHKKDILESRLEYPKKNKKFRHYGVNVQKLIEKAAQVEEPEKQEKFANAIGSYMKMAYRNWNSAHYASDEVIKGDLKSMSKGELALDESVALDFLSDVQQPLTRSRSKKRTQHGGNRKNRSRGHKNKRRR